MVYDFLQLVADSVHVLIAVVGVDVHSLSGEVAELFQRVASALQGGDVAHDGDTVAEAAGGEVPAAPGEERRPEERRRHTEVVQAGVVGVHILKGVEEGGDGVVLRHEGVADGDSRDAVDWEQGVVEGGRGFQVGHGERHGVGAVELHRPVDNVPLRQAQRGPAVAVLIGHGLHILVAGIGLFFLVVPVLYVLLVAGLLIGVLLFAAGEFFGGFLPGIVGGAGLLRDAVPLHAAARLLQGGVRAREAFVVGRQDFRREAQIFLRRVGQIQRALRAALPNQNARVEAGVLFVPGEFVAAVEREPFLGAPAHVLH